MRHGGDAVFLHQPAQPLLVKRLAAAAGEHERTPAAEPSRRLEDLHRPTGQLDPVLAVRLHPLSRDGPYAASHVNLRPLRPAHLARPRRRQHLKLERQLDDRCGTRRLHRLDRRRHLPVRKRPHVPHLTLLAAEHRPNAIARVVGAVVHGNCPLHHRIEASPARLREVEGIGPKRADRITAAWADQKRIREIMVFLHQHGVGTARAVRIFKTYGADAVQVMSENPYRLARDIRGIGFRTADLIAERLGIEKTAMIQVRAGIAFALTEAMGDGHC